MNTAPCFEKMIKAGTHINEKAKRKTFSLVRNKLIFTNTIAKITSQ